MHANGKLLTRSCFQHLTDPRDFTALFGDQGKSELESDIQTRQWRTSRPTNSDRINPRSHLTYYGNIELFKTEASNICFVVSP
jgi:hypothetical protein